MKKHHILALILLLFIIGACNNDDCEGNLCTTPPESFDFIFVDKDTKEDIFISGKYSINDLEIIDLNTQTKINDYIVSADEEYTYIFVNTIGWETETVNYQFSFGDKLMCNLIVDAVRKYENCCSFTQFNEVDLENCEYEIGNDVIDYIVLVE